ncbi:EAL domain-containing protein [Pseudomonas sp. WHRI 8519]|uniref:EAL domain-containing protein n=1 Tax=Pseudomonas sp. WHRI 8519 TaxID=3162567 RepID=UPI0032EFC10D
MAGALTSGLCVAVAVGCSIGLAWLMVLKSTERQLDVLAELAVQRADQTIAMASDALRHVADSQLPACSPEGIEQMNLLVLNTLSVKSVGYAEEEVLACSTSGVSRQPIPDAGEDFRTQNGVSVYLPGYTQSVAPEDDLLTLSYAAFHLLLDSGPLKDTSLEPGFHLALGTPMGRWLSSGSNDAFTRLLSVIHDGDRSKLEQGFLYRRVSRGDWHVVVALSREKLVSQLWLTLLVVLPPGVFLAVLGLRSVARRTLERLSPQAELKQAIRHGRIQAHYQPIIDLRSGQCRGAEALVRLQHPVSGWISPECFLPLAQEAGLIEAITDRMIMAICSDLGDYLRSDRSRHVSLNLTAADICNGRYLEVLGGAIAEAGVHAQQVWLEVTENDRLDLEPARLNLATSRLRQHLVALDDFGTGYSSLQYLQHLPVDLIKIDKGFVERIDQVDDHPVLEHTIALAHEMGLAMVGEGIETERQLQFLQSRGVEFGQGWLFARPMAAAEFINFSQRMTAF